MLDHAPPTMHWGTEALWQQLVPLLPGLSVEVVHSTRSTNTTLLERARAVPNTSPAALDAIVHASVESGAFGRRSIDLQPCLLVAEHQSAGRGRQGRSWHSAPGASLTFSLALPLRMPDWSGLSLAIGVAIAEALDSAHDGPARVGLKWPNDLWLLGEPNATRKLGGILIETVSAGTQRLAVIGIGLNVQRFDPIEANTGFAPLLELDTEATPPAVLARIALPLVKALKQFEREGFAAFAERFAARDVLTGRPVTTTMPDAPHGIARGVSAQGALLLETDAGLREVTGGEVSVRLAPPPKT
ncbi:MAG TPA: biotin--[acetyl-CoA-carboxylase] ligase [Burkholderiaceae bacterium]|jgi:BirA family biotin operon repressor/biotin-[acetyl-CoA-carboxylase] ligase